jgi:hypothetical protein
MKMSIGDLLVFTRGQLMQAREARDEAALQTLATFNEFFLRAAYSYEDVEAAKILEAFEDSIRDSFHQVEWKSTIPSEDEIRALDM